MFADWKYIPLKQKGKMKTKKAKKKNPNDATFRNITALKRRVSLLEYRVMAVIDFLTGKVKKAKKK